MLCLIGCLLHPSAWLLIARDWMAVRHHDDVFILAVAGTASQQFVHACLDGTVSVCALADVLDAVHSIFQQLPLRGNVTQTSHHLDLVTVVKCSRVPSQVAITRVAHVFEFINEELGEVFDLIDVEVGRFDS